MSCKVITLGVPKIEQLDEDTFVDWHRKKIITKGLASGTHYASYYDKECKNFSFWLTREHIKYIRVNSTATVVNNTPIG